MLFFSLFLQKFFSHVDTWESKLKVLREKGIQLVALTDDSTSEGIRSQLACMDGRWQDMLSKARTSKSSAIESAWQEYGDRVAKLKSSIETGEKLLKYCVEAEHEQIQEHTETLQV